MENTEISKNNASSKQGEETLEEVGFQELIQSLPKETNCFGNAGFLYQNFWCPSRLLKAIVSFQNHFQALDDDIILAGPPKCGNTWLKSLVFTIVNRNRFEFKDSPLLSSNPSQIVPFFEFEVYFQENPSLYLDNNPSNPRIFSTHTPYASLPHSIKDSNCKIVYIYRNPMDVFISYWHFINKLQFKGMKPVTLDEGFEMFCQGMHSFGPFSDHVLGFWEAANKRRDVLNKIFFIKYEDLKEDTAFHIKELAKFLGFPFSEQEEEQGVVGEVVKLCSFENLKNLEVNRDGGRPGGVPNAALFRKGIVGDWNNYLTPSMVNRLENLIHEKLDHTGLVFKK